MAQGRSGGLLWEGYKSVPGDRTQGGSHHDDAVVELGFTAPPSAVLREEKMNTQSCSAPQRMKAAGSSWDKSSCRDHRGIPGRRQGAKAEPTGQTPHL